MYEQWHPLGVIGVISAFNFPVAVWSWNAFLAAVCGDITIWKPSPKTPLCAIASMKICNAALRDAGFPDLFFLFNDAGTDLAQAFVDDRRSEEHTSELQSLMRISYAVFCLQQKTNPYNKTDRHTHLI